MTERDKKINVETYFREDLFHPVIQLGRNDVFLPRVLRRVFPLPRRPLEFRELEDLSVAEDVLSAIVLLRQSEEFGGGFGGGEDLVPRKAPCLDNVLGGLASDKNVGVVVARGFLVRLKVVFFLFKPVALAEVVAAADEVGGSILDGGDVGGSFPKVEDGSGALEAGGEYDDGVIVNPLVRVVFAAEFDPVGVVERVEEVGEFIGVDLRGLRPSEKITLSVGAERHEGRRKPSGGTDQSLPIEIL